MVRDRYNSCKVIIFVLQEAAEFFLVLTGAFLNLTHSYPDSNPNPKENITKTTLNNSNFPRFSLLQRSSGEKCGKFELLQKSCTSKLSLHYFPSWFSILNVSLTNIFCPVFTICRVSELGNFALIVFFQFHIQTNKYRKAQFRFIFFQKSIAWRIANTLHL